MTITDIFTFVGIAVSIIFGFFISHLSSIRDSRTRIIKDHYIEQIKSIKGRVDTFFHQLIFGKSSFRKVVKWYDHIRLDISSVDVGVRKCLDIQMKEFGDILDKYYNEITGWSDFNDQYRLTHYTPTSDCKEKLCNIKYQIDEFLNDYIQHVNQANNYHIVSEQYQKIKQSHSYYKEANIRFPLVKAIIHRIKNHSLELLSIIAIIVVFIFLCLNIKEEETTDLTLPLNEISSELDTINNSINQFKDKYEPVEVKTKTFHNSAFFNADKVDSVQIKLYQDK